MLKKTFIVFVLAVSPIVLGNAAPVLAQTDAGGRAGGSMGDSDSSYRARPKPRVKRVTPRTVSRVQKTAAAYEADGDRFYDAKNMDDALEAYETAAKKKPTVHSLYRIAWIHNDYEEYDQALPFAERAIALGPQVAYLHVEKGYALRHLNRNAEALASFTRAVQLDPNSTLGYLGQGDVYFYGTKEYQKAIDSYTRGLQLDGTKQVAAYNIGWAYNELGNYNSALRYLTQATSIKADYAAAYAEAGYAYNKLDQTPNAINAYRRALQYDASSTNALFGLGDVYFDKEKNYVLAADQYKRGVAIKTDNVNAWYRLGYCYNDNAQYSDAVTALTKAKQLNPDLNSANVELGYAYFQLKRLNEAASVLRQATAADRSNALAHYYLGQVYLASGDRNSAMVEYRNLKALDSDYAEKLLQMINARPSAPNA